MPGKPVICFWLFSLLLSLSTASFVGLDSDLEVHGRIQRENGMERGRRQQEAGGKELSGGLGTALGSVNLIQFLTSPSADFSCAESTLL